MVDIFSDGSGLLPFGHHKVTMEVTEDFDGDQMVIGTPKGPRVTFTLKSVNGGGSIRHSQTFNSNCQGLLDGINQAMGKTKAQADELVSEMPTPTGFDVGSVHNLCALWTSSEGGWIEVVPKWLDRDGEKANRREDGGPYSDVKFRKHTEPPVIRTASDPSYVEDYVTPTK